MSINDFKAAAADLDDAVVAKPQNLQAWTSRGMAYERLGDTEKAAGSYAKAININKDPEPAEAGFARLGGQAGRGIRRSEPAGMPDTGGWRRLSAPPAFVPCQDVNAAFACARAIPHPQLRFQWPADLLMSWAFEMETLILGWYVLVETGSVLF